MSPENCLTPYAEQRYNFTADLTSFIRNHALAVVPNYKRSHCSTGTMENKYANYDWKVTQNCIDSSIQELYSIYLQLDMNKYTHRILR